MATTKVPKDKLWMIMDILVSTSIGHTAIHSLCMTIDDGDIYRLMDLKIIRGAIYFIGRILWDSNILDYMFPVLSILELFLKAIHTSRNILVAAEILKSLKRLLLRHQNHLNVEWVLFSQILIECSKYLDEDIELVLTPVLQDVINVIEDQETAIYFKDEEFHFSLIQSISPLVKESYIIAMLNDIVGDIHPINENWIDILEKITKSYFYNEKRPNIRVKSLEVIKRVFDAYKNQYSDLIMQKTMLSVKESYMHNDETTRFRFLDLYFYMCSSLKTSTFFTATDFMYTVVMGDVACISTKRKIATKFNTLFIEKFSSAQTNQVISIFERLLDLTKHPDRFIQSESLSTLLMLKGTAKSTIKLNQKTSIFLRIVSKDKQSNIHSTLPIGELINALANMVVNKNALSKQTSEGLVGFLNNRWIMQTIQFSQIIDRLIDAIKYESAIPDNIDHLIYVSNVIVAMTSYVAKENESKILDIIECLMKTISSIASERNDDKILRHYVYGVIHCVPYVGSLKVIEKLLARFISLVHQTLKDNDPPENSLNSKFYILESLLFLSKQYYCTQQSSSYINEVFKLLLYFTNPVYTSPAITNFAFQVLMSWYVCCDTPTRMVYYKKLNKEIGSQNSQKRSSILESYLDLISKTTFSNCEPVPISQNNSLLFNSTSKSQVWIHGNSIITIKFNECNWTNVTIRRPSGKLSWTVQLQNKQSMDEIHGIIYDYINYLTELKESTHLGLSQILDISTRHYKKDQKLFSRTKRSSSLTSASEIEAGYLPYMHPSFVYAQLQQAPYQKSQPKLIKTTGESLERALSVLDLTIPSETYKIGVLYVYNGQRKQEDILGNTHGSPKFFKFLENLGDLVLLKNADFYTGGLDKSENLDGKYTILWRDSLKQMVFHVSTMMPNYQNDFNFNNKKRHIGNDFVTIVWHDWDSEYDPEIFSGQFNFITLVIYPLDKGWYRIQLKKKPQIPFVGPLLNCQIVLENDLPNLVRTTVMSAHTICKHFQLQENLLESVSNYEERLRQIKQIGSRFEVDKETSDLLVGKRLKNKAG